MESEEHIVELATRIVYSVDELSHGLRVRWSRTLTILFGDKLIESQLQYVESRSAVRKFSDTASAQLYIRNIPKDEAVAAIAAVATLGDYARSINDGLTASRIDKMLKALTLSELSEQAAAIEKLHTTWLVQLRAYYRRPVVKIPLRIWPLALDFLLRCGALCIVNAGLVSYEPFVGITNGVVIPLFIIGLVFWVSRLDKNFNQRLMKQYSGGRDFAIQLEISSIQYTWIAVFLGASIYINYLLNSDIGNGIGLLSFVLLIGLCIYYVICLRFFGVGRIREGDLDKQIVTIDAQRKLRDIDENDEVIVTLETKLNATTSRLEAYVLESALFGALSFSGFLQVIANNIISVTDMERFATAVIDTSSAFLRAQWEEVNAGLAFLDTSASLFCLVSIESLLCSIFFLAVIASRLQFSDVADKIRDSLNLAKVYNAKEEAILSLENGVEKNQERLITLNARINSELERSEKIMQELGPVINYMQYFRNAGILVFLIILISSSLFITGALAWCFAVLAGATLLYFDRKNITNRINSFFITLRVQFISRGTALAVAAAVCVLTSFFLRVTVSQGVSATLMAFGILLLGIYGYIWIFFSPHYDAKFGDIEKSEASRFEGSRWKITRNTFGYAVLATAVGLIFKYLHLTGGNEMMLIALVLLAVITYVVGYYLCKKKWLGVVIGFPLATTLMGILFKILHLAGSHVMLLTGLTLLTILFFIIFIWRRLFHRFLIQIYLVILVVNIYFVFGFRLSAAYDLGTLSQTEFRTYNAELDALEVDVAYVLSGDVENSIAVQALKMDESIRRRHAYLSSHPDLPLIRYQVLLMIVDRSFTQSALDSLATIHDEPTRALVLSAAQKTAADLIALETKYKFSPDTYLEAKDLLMESDVLVAMGKKDEAVASLERVILLNPPKEMKEILENRLKQFEN